MTNHDPRILAIDLRPQQFGYAAFEGPKRLLDWGEAHFRPGGRMGAASAQRSVARLSRHFFPSVIVVKKVDRTLPRNSHGTSLILKAIRREAATRAIPVCLIGRSDVRHAFRMFRAKNKYEIAAVLVRVFPELIWNLQPVRKNSDSEHPIMTTFDAIALGFTYWQNHGTQIPPPE
jgi:hypothetical protein